MTSFQSSELTELPVVENSQLFAQRVHSARYAPRIKNQTNKSGGMKSKASLSCFLTVPLGVVEHKKRHKQPIKFLIFLVHTLVSWQSPLTRWYSGEFRIMNQSFPVLRLSHSSVW